MTRHQLPLARFFFQKMIVSRSAKPSTANRRIKHRTVTCFVESNSRERCYAPGAWVLVVEDFPPVGMLLFEELIYFLFRQEYLRKINRNVLGSRDLFGAVLEEIFDGIDVNLGAKRGHNPLS